MDCLDDKTVRALAAGAPPAPPVEAHLASCATCRRRLEAARPAQRFANDAAWNVTRTVPLEASPAPRPRPLRGPLTELPRGTTVGRYTVLELVGRGGMGEVYAAYDSKLDRKIALKLLQTDESGAEARAEARLLREAQAIAKVSHPNVVTVHDAGTFGDRVFVAMEYVDGGTLKDWLAAAPRSRRDVLEVFAAAARGLAAAHAAGLVHRDFKPPNVMVGKDGGVRVTDFGLVRQIGGDAEAEPDDDAPVGAPRAAGEPEAELGRDLTRTGEMVGTPRYMAPEQFKSEALDARADQFSFCVSLYEALYGQLPFAGDTLPVLVTNVLLGEVSPPPAKSTVPGWLRRVLLRGLEVEPARRYPSMEALLAALSADPTTRRRRLALAIAVVGCIALAAVGTRRLGDSKTRLCHGGAERWATAWSAGDAATIHRAFAATGKGYAEQTFASVTRLLDDYGRRWIGMYTDACEATQVRGEQSADVLDLRMSCLQGRLGNARALTDVFVHADGPVVENAVAAAGALPLLDRCADVALLKAVVRPPENEALRARVESLRGELARLVALRDAGHCQESEKLAQSLIPRAREAGYQPLLADTLLAAGYLAENCVAVSIGEARLEEAFSSGLAGRNDEAAAAAAIMLSPFHYNRDGDVREAERWLTLARSMLRRFDNHPLLDAWLLVSEGLALESTLHGAAAAEVFRRSAEVKEKVLGKDNSDTVMSLMNEGNALSDAGRGEDAVRIFVEGGERLQRIVGPDHPRVAMLLSNEGEALNSIGRFRDATAACRRSSEIFRAAGSDPSFVAYGLTCLGVALVGDGRPADAVAPLEEALRIRLAQHPAPNLFGETRFALARALWSRPADRPRALATARAARDDYAQGANDVGKVAAIDAWLAAPDALSPGGARP